MRDLEAPVVRNVIARTTRSAPETEAVGEALGRGLRSGDVLLLVGELGAGKTTFVRGLARGLGVASGVKSPTFAIHVRYPGRMPVHHVDLYRIEDPRDLGELGLEEFLGGDGVVVVEWGDRLGDLAPTGSLLVTFIDLGGDDRRLEIAGPRERETRISAVGGWETGT